MSGSQRMEAHDQSSYGKEAPAPRMSRTRNLSVRDGTKTLVVNGTGLCLTYTNRIVHTGGIPATWRRDL